MVDSDRTKWRPIVHSFPIPQWIARFNSSYDALKLKKRGTYTFKHLAKNPVKKYLINIKLKFSLTKFICEWNRFYQRGAFYFIEQLGIPSKPALYFFKTFRKHIVS